MTRSWRSSRRCCSATQRREASELAANPRRRKLMGEINVVPYIDVMLVLLIIFMITAPLLTQGVQVELPDANARPLDPGTAERP